MATLCNFFPQTNSAVTLWNNVVCGDKVANLVGPPQKFYISRQGGSTSYSRAQGVSVLVQPLDYVPVSFRGGSYAYLLTIATGAVFMRPYKDVQVTTCRPGSKCPRRFPSTIFCHASILECANDRLLPQPRKLLGSTESCLSAPTLRHANDLFLPQLRSFFAPTSILLSATTPVRLYARLEQPQYTLHLLWCIRWIPPTPVA